MRGGGKDTETRRSCIFPATTVTMRIHYPAVGILALAGTIAIWLVYEPANSAGPKKPISSDLTPVTEQEREVAPVQSTLPAPQPTTTAESNELLTMPDGQQLPPLNGVTKSADPAWPKGRPYSPVTGTRMVNGIEYYAHADGTLTTTRYLWRTDLNRFDATTVVKQPIATQTTER